MDEAFLAQLSDSIQQLGIQVPLLVRPMPGNAVNTDPGFEIVAGHRRYEAALRLKMGSVPCIVREMTDEEAREVMLVENLQRADLDSMDEAEAYEALQATLGTAQAIAAKVGKPIEYVTRRLKLLTLIPSSREALSSKLITIDHALLLAKLAAAEQETALRFALDRSNTRKQKTLDLLAKARERAASGRDEWLGSYWEPASVLDLKRFIEDEIKLELARAPWDLADAALVPSAGACVGCPKNTAANTALFGDLAVTDARCTDSVCFAAKRAAFVERELAAVKAAGADAVRVSWKSTSAKPRAVGDADNKKYLGQIFKAGQWIEAKKSSCVFVRMGVAVDFDAPTWGTPDAKKVPGVKLLVCVDAGCKTHRKAWEEPRPAASGPRNENSPEARAEREKKAEAAKAENAIRAGLLKKALERVTRLSGELLRAVVLQAVPDWPVEEAEQIFPELENALRKSKVDSAQFARAAASLLFFNEREESFVPEWQGAEYRRKGFIDTLKLLGFDGRAAWKAKSAATSKKSTKAPATKSTKTRAKKRVVKSAGKKAVRA